MSDFNRTLALIKPDAINAGHMVPILTRIDKEFRIMRMVLTEWTLSGVQSFYEEHVGRPYYDELRDAMCAGPVCVLVLERSDAIARWREMMGPTDPLKAPEGTIRGDFAAKDGVIAHNCVHGSDSPNAYLREADVLRQNLVLGYVVR